MFKGLKARLNDSIASSDASFISAETSTPNTSAVNNISPDGGLFGKFKQKINEVVSNTTLDVETPESVLTLTEEEIMDIDKLLIVTPSNKLPELFKKQSVGRLKLRKKVRYVIGQYNGLVTEHNAVQDENKVVKEELTKSRTSAALAGEYEKQLTERAELISLLQSQVEILKDTALVAEHGGGAGGAALIDVSELSESVMSDASETVQRNMSYEQLYDRYQRYKLRYEKNKTRLDMLSVTCQKLQKQNENLQKCLTVSQDRAIQKINQLKNTTHTIVDEHRELVSSLNEKDYRITSLQDQLHSISSMGASYSDTESIMSEASEYNTDVVTDSLRRRNAKLKDKVWRLEEVLAKCKTTIKNGIDATNSLSTEKEALARTLEKEALASTLEKVEFELEEERVKKEVSSNNEVLIDLEEEKESLASGSGDPAKIKELLAEVKRHKDEETSRSNEIFQLVTEIERMKQDMIKLNAEAESQKVQAESLGTELTLSRQQAVESERYKEKLSQEFSVRENSLEHQVSEYQQEKDSIQSQLETVQVENKKLKDGLHDRDVAKAMEMQDTRSEHTGQVTLLNNKVTALKKELDSATRQLNILKDTDTSLQDLLEEMLGIRGELERVSTENTELRHEMSVRDRQLEESKEEREFKIEESSKNHRLEIERIVEKHAIERDEHEEKTKVLIDKQQELALESAGLIAECEKVTKELKETNENRAKEKSEWENKYQRLVDGKIHEREGLEEAHRAQLTPFKTKIKEMQVQISKLQEAKTEQEDEISDLTRHVFESNSDCAQLNNEVTELQGKIASAEKSVSLLQDQIRTKTAESVDLTDSLGNVNDNLAAIRLTLSELQSQFDQISQEKEDISQSLENAQTERARLENEKRDVGHIVEDLKKNIHQSAEEHVMKCHQLENDINNIMTEREFIKHEYEESQLRYSKLEEALASNSDGSEVLSQENSELKSKMKELQESLSSLQEKLSLAESTNKAHQEEREQLQLRLTAATEQNSNTNSALDNSIAQLKHTLELTQNEKYDLESRVAELERERDDIIEDSNERKDKFEEEHRSIEEILSQVKQDLLVCEDQLNNSKLENEKYREKVDTLTSQINQLDSAHQLNTDLSGNIKELVSDVDIKSKTIAKLEAESITKTSEFNSRINSLQKDLESSHTTCELLRKQCDKSQEEVEVSESRREEELRNLAEKREEDLKMFAAQHQEELKKQEEFENESVHLSGQVRELESKMESEVANHQKAKEGLGRASQAIGKLRGFVKEQDAKVVRLTKINEELQRKSKENAEQHNSSLSEVQQSYMHKLEASAETENSLKFELKSVQSELSELESRVGELVEEKKQLREIMRDKMEENDRLLAQVDSVKEAEADNMVSVEREAEITDMQKKLSLQNNEIKQLQNDVQTCKNTENQLKVKLVELKKKAEAKIIELSEDKKKCVAQLTALTTRQEESDNRMSEVSSRLRVVAEEKALLLSKSEESKEVMQSQFKSKISEMSAEVKSLNEESQSKESKIEVLEEQVQRFKMQLDAWGEKISALQTELGEALSSSTDSSLQVLTLQKNLEDANRNLELLKSDEVHNKYAELSIVYKETEKQLSEKLQCLEESFKENEKITEDLRISVETKDEAINDLKSKLAESLRESLSEVTKQHELEGAKLRAEVETLQNNYASLQDEEENVKHEKESLDKENKTFCNEIESLKQDILSIRDELSQSKSILDQQEHIISSSQEKEFKLKEELDMNNRKLEKETNRATELQGLTNSLKSEISSHTGSQEQLSLLSNQFKQKISQLQTALSLRDEELTSIREDNSALSSHAAKMETQFTALQEEKDKILESVSQVMSDKEVLERSHRAEVEETKARLETEHALNLQLLTRAMEEKVQSVSQDEKLVQSLQTQIKKLQLSVCEAQEEVKISQARCTVTVSEYSSKLLSLEKKCASLRELATERLELLKSRDQEVLKIRSDNMSEISLLKRDSISKCSHDELVFNLEMAYNMNIQETTERLESRIKELESMLGGDAIPPTSQKENIADLKRHADNLTRRHKVELDTVRNEAVFAASQEYNAKLKERQEANEQNHLEEMNMVMEDNSRERQRLLREIDILQDRQTDKQTNIQTLNISGPGTISVTSEQSDLFFLDTEFEYLKDILLKYLKGEHTEQLLKVIIAILRYSDEEKFQILKTLSKK